MVVSFGYLVLRQVLQLIVLGMRGDGAKEVEIMVLRQVKSCGVVFRGRA